MEKFFRVLEKLLVPIFLGVLAFFTASSGNKISKQQTQLIEFQNARDAEDSKRQLELKYLELFYQDISSADPDKQTKAIGLLSLMNPELGQQLSTWVKDYVTLTPQTRARIERIDSQLSGNTAVNELVNEPEKEPTVKQAIVDTLTKKIVEKVTDIAIENLGINIPLSYSQKSKDPVFRLKSRNVASYKCEIRSLTGTTVFSGQGNEVIWDGTDSSKKKVSKGIYNYEVEALTNSGQTLTRSGKILII
ncbi:MAG: hypothetical protein RBS38_03020 [Bacteroidales bacterium]|jgi:hypothetical protein|nr:hypothetical protein [Bacteroidales bacterium]